MLKNTFIFIPRWATTNKTTICLRCKSSHLCFWWMYQQKYGKLSLSTQSTKKNHLRSLLPRILISIITIKNLQKCTTLIFSPNKKISKKIFRCVAFPRLIKPAEKARVSKKKLESSRFVPIHRSTYLVLHGWLTWFYFYFLSENVGLWRRSRLCRWFRWNKVTQRNKKKTV